MHSSWKSYQFQDFKGSWFLPELSADFFELWPDEEADFESLTSGDSTTELFREN